VGFGPEFLVAVFIEVGDLLDGGPAQNGVVTYKGCYIAVGNGVADSCVDEIGEESDTGNG